MCWLLLYDLSCSGISTIHAVFISVMSMYFVFWSEIFSDQNPAGLITFRNSPFSTFALGVSSLCNLQMIFSFGFVFLTKYLWCFVHNLWWGILKYCLLYLFLNMAASVGRSLVWKQISTFQLSISSWIQLNWQNLSHHIPSDTLATIFWECIDVIICRALTFKI